MILAGGETLGAAFADAAARWGARDFVVAPPGEGASRGFTYGAAAAQAARWAGALARAGYGAGHRVAVMVGNRPEHLVLKLALNARGISIVPVNPDYRPGEIAYLLADSAAVLAVTDAAHAPLLRAGIAEAGRAVPVVLLDALEEAPPAPDPQDGVAGPETEASLLYTSGTTGRPKGCILSHAYELSVGRRYATAGGLMALRDGERVLNPLPLYHLNAACVSFVGLMLTGGCQVQSPRFSRSRWWAEVRESGATAFHYLGIIIPALMSAPPSAADRAHGARLGIGAGVEPSLHAPFEARFGVELVEVWGMTEMCRILTANEAPGLPGTRAIGRAFPGLEALVADEAGEEVPRGRPGELLIRHSAATPRAGFFSGYLNRPEATEEAWRGGWFHTGDTVTMDEGGMIFFVDRKKNIVRRSGENIAAAEVEACLQERGEVAQVAVIAVPDAVREEEVMACIVPAEGVAGDAALARALFDHVHARLAYYKAPGWVLFLPGLPVTGTQKVVKHGIFAAGEDPRERPGVQDFRALKQR